jgi:hypothetical protein
MQSKNYLWLKKQKCAENKKQGDALGLLIKYYKTGSLKLGMIIISLGYQLLKETLITLTDSLKCIMILWDIEVRMKELYKLRILICQKMEKVSKTHSGLKIISINGTT